MEMDRGRADSQRLGELAQAEPICADALDSLAAAATIAALVRSARVPAFRFSLTFGLEVFFLGIVMMATMTLAMSRERGGAKRSNQAPTRTTGARFACEREEGRPSRRRSPATPLRPRIAPLALS